MLSGNKIEQETNISIAKISDEEQFSYLSELYLSYVTKHPFQNFELREISRQHFLQRKKLTLFHGKKNEISNGYCFQLAQQLYQTLLEKGFNASRCLARVLNGLEVNSKELLIFPATHLIITVEINKKTFLLDPGLGPRAPIYPVLVDSDNDIGDCLFRVRTEKGIFVLEKRKENDWIQLIQSDLKPVSNQKIKFALLKLEKHPGEIGIRDHKLVVGIATKTGSKCLYKGLSDSVFIYREESNDKIIVNKNINDHKEVCSLLQTEFNINHITPVMLENYCNKSMLSKPKRRWSIELPLDQELKRLNRNLRPG